MMSTIDIAVINDTVHLTNVLLMELTSDAGCTERQHTLVAFRVVLRVLRDRMIVNDAVHLGAQLPTLMHGFYYESWHPAATPSREFNAAGFLVRIERELHTDPEVSLYVFACHGKSLYCGLTRMLMWTLTRVQEAKCWLEMAGWLPTSLVRVSNSFVCPNLLAKQR
ncbi:MAG: DUF2267 domain-containing protein [Rhodospirillaceae bacterium]